LKKRKKRILELGYGCGLDFLAVLI